MCTLKIIFNEPVHLIVLWLKPDVKGAKRVLVCEAVCKDGVDVDSRVADIAWCGCLDLTKDSKKRAGKDERGAEVIQAVGVTEGQKWEGGAAIVCDGCQQTEDAVMWV